LIPFDNMKVFGAINYKILNAIDSYLSKNVSPNTNSRNPQHDMSL